ncbi:MAG: hypothetical protein ACWGSD_05100, partial [Thermodesulfobacteriota bacterium]
WSYPPDVPVSGFCVHWAGEAGFPLSAGQSLDKQQRCVRIARPYPEAVFFCMSAFREGENGEILESAPSRLVPFPAGEAMRPSPGQGASAPSRS